MALLIDHPCVQHKLAIIRVLVSTCHDRTKDFVRSTSANSRSFLQPTYSSTSLQNTSVSHLSLYYCHT